MFLVILSSDLFREVQETKDAFFDWVKLMPKVDIKNHKIFCIMAVKRSLNYHVINPSQSKKFVKDFYNLIFS